MRYGWPSVPQGRASVGWYVPSVVRHLAVPATVDTQTGFSANIPVLNRSVMISGQPLGLSRSGVTSQTTVHSGKTTQHEVDMTSRLAQPGTVSSGLSGTSVASNENHLTTTMNPQPPSKRARALDILRGFIRRFGRMPSIDEKLNLAHRYQL